MSELEQRLGYKFKDEELLKEALTHKSSKKPYSNERLEFLGDAVLDLVVGEYLFLEFKDLAEGEMSKLRAALVNESSFAKMACNVGVGEGLFLSPAEEHNGGRSKPSLLSDAFEAIIGAIYLESGLDVARDIFLKLLKQNYPDINLKLLTKDYKTRLQEITQAKYGVVPRYDLISAIGPDHKKEFEVALFLNDEELSRAKGSSKKQAQQEAAKFALKFFEQGNEQ